MKHLVLLLCLALGLVACSKGTSKPNYSFKASRGDGVVAEAGKVKITEKELYQGIESEIYDIEMKKFDVLYNKLQAVLMDKLMADDPNKKGLTNDQYMDKYIVSKIKISQKEINDFIEERKIPKQHINDQVKERIKTFLTMEKKKDALEQWMGKKLGKTDVNVFFKKPRRPVFDVAGGNSPFFGGKDAKVEIVEFSDFQCPHCAKASNLISDLKKAYGKKIKIVFKQFPLPFHQQAKGAALAALCANEQGAEKFWKLHDKMFADQSKLNIADLQNSAKTLGLKADLFNKCLTSKKYASEVEADIAYGQKVGVKSTPTFFVNGQLVAGAQPIEVFKEIIDSELKK